MIPQTLLAIDPGASTGWAFFVGATLESCGACGPDEDIRAPAALRVVIENPQIYPHSKARPKDILTLARIVGRYQERFRASSVLLVPPREWKGTIAKGIMLARIRKGLNLREKSLVLGLPDDTIDAIGLGKWAIKTSQSRMAQAKGSRGPIDPHTQGPPQFCAESPFIR